MVSRHHYGFGACLTILSSSLFLAQGCIIDGDASLGSNGASGGAEAGSGSKAGSTSQAGSTNLPVGGKGGSGGKSGAGGTSIDPGSGEGGGELGTAGEPPASGGQGGGASGICELPIETGPCDAAIPRYAFDAKTGQCKPFTYGGCEGNANNFGTQTDCQAACETRDCPDHLQSDTVYVVAPLNRPERACILLDAPILVSCSMLLDPSLTVPTGYGQTFCVKRDDALYYAGTTLPKADGWEDCSTQEADMVAQAPDCNDL